MPGRGQANEAAMKTPPSPAPGPITQVLQTPRRPALKTTLSLCRPRSAVTSGKPAPTYPHFWSVTTLFVSLTGNMKTSD